IASSRQGLEEAEPSLWETLGKHRRVEEARDEVELAQGRDAVLAGVPRGTKGIGGTGRPKAAAGRKAAARPRGDAGRGRGSTRAAALRAWARRFPLKAMRKNRFSLPPDTPDPDALLKFFGVDSPEDQEAAWAAHAVSYRQTQVFDARREAVAAWVREAEIV